MDISVFLRSAADQDKAPIVICDIDNTVIYMNPASVKKYGKDLTGSCIFSCHGGSSNELILKTVKWFSENSDNNIIHTFYSAEENKDVYMVALRDESKKLIGYYEKHEYRSPDTAPFYDYR